MTAKTNKLLQRISLLRSTSIKQVLILAISMGIMFCGYGQSSNNDAMARLITIKPKEMKVYELHEVTTESATKIKYLIVRASETSTGEVCSLLGKTNELEYCQILGGNKLNMDSIFVAMKHLRKLEYLSVENLKTISKNVKLLKKLKWLGFYNSEIASISEELYKLKKLEWLNLGYIYGHLASGNNISVIPPGISKLKKLSYLFIEDNPIQVIPDELCRLKKLVLIKTNTKSSLLEYPDCLVGKISFSE